MREITPGGLTEDADAMRSENRAVLPLTSKLLISVEAPSHAHALASMRVLIVLEQTIRVGLMPTLRSLMGARGREYQHI